MRASRVCLTNNTQTHDLRSSPLTCNRITRVLTFVAICHRCKVLGSCCPHTGCFLTNEQAVKETTSRENQAWYILATTFTARIACRILPAACAARQMAGPNSTQVYPLPPCLLPSLHPLTISRALCHPTDGVYIIQHHSMHT